MGATEGAADSASGLFLVDRSIGRVLLRTSLGVTVGCSEVGSAGVDVLTAASVLLVDGLAVGLSGHTAGLLMEVCTAWFDWAS